MSDERRDDLDAKGIVLMSKPTSADLRLVWLTSFATAHVSGFTGNEAAEAGYRAVSDYLEWCASVKGRLSAARLEESDSETSARGPKG